ncbi:MAG: two-component system, chemotaxis family, protein-glutamate methylesterase/glutaminase [Candidatus Binatota bacterium]|nr:two-component system, chemotaxis family, protein-glutamate methylesterase/glutaminase [Candidatus Binatota bacterium]
MNTLAEPNIHVLVVDDSAVVREVLTAILSLEPGIAVATASDPLIAMNKMKQRRPDVVVLDLDLPRMDGMTFLQKIMREDPLPVVICSALTGPNTSIGLQALEEGAVDVITKPRIAVREFLHESAVLLTDVVRAAARSHAKLSRAASSRIARRTGESNRPEESHPTRPRRCDRIIAIGASTGGTEALRDILEALPADIPGLVVVQHMPEGFTAAFAQRLDRTCRIEVKEAVHGDPVLSGRALIAPGNRHMLVRPSGVRWDIEISDGPLVSRHRPSVDVLFRSVAQHAGAHALGIILTGMGSDGAAGLLEMRRAGAFTIAQDEASSVVFGMPKEAIDRGAVLKVASLAKIPEEILHAGFEPQRVVPRMK